MAKQILFGFRNIPAALAVSICLRGKPGVLPHQCVYKRCYLSCMHIPWRESFERPVWNGSGAGRMVGEEAVRYGKGYFQASDCGSFPGPKAV